MHNLDGKSDRTSGYFLIFCMVQEILSKCSLFALLIIYEEFCAIGRNNINIQQMFSAAYPSFQLTKETVSYQTRNCAAFSKIMPLHSLNIY
jgi:hypothetical protein